MNYSIIIDLIPEKNNNIEYYFWYITNNSTSVSSNCGHGWAPTIIEAAKDAEAYYKKIMSKD